MTKGDVASISTPTRRDGGDDDAATTSAASSAGGDDDAATTSAALDGGGDDDVATTSAASSDGPTSVPSGLGTWRSATVGATVSRPLAIRHSETFA